MKALYRKYRSKALKEVMGQEHITETLERVLKSGAINHAYLFTGPRGVGKTSVARILAHELNKIPYTDESLNLDIIEIDAASNRRIDDIRDLREKVHISPVSAPYKIYIIDEAHMLTGESFNALLKTLEEPPSHVIFILATTEFHKLPATIVSRTQRFHFRPVPKDKVVSHLKTIAKKEQIDIDDEALELIAEHGDGSFRDSISLLDQLSSMNDKKVTGELVEKILGLAGKSTVNKILSLIKQRQAAKLHTLLDELESTGVNAPVLSAQLIRQIKLESKENPKLYTLIGELIDIHKNPNSWLKLFVVLLRAASNKDGSMQSITETGTVASHKPASKATNASIDKAIAELSRTPSQIRRHKIPLEPKEELTVTDTIEKTGATGTDRFDPEGWAKVLNELQKTDPPLFSIVKQSEPRFLHDSLTIAVKFKLHKNKLDDNRYRSKLIGCINGLGYECPELSMVYDPSATAITIKTSGTKQVDETTSDVLAMMGGGEVING